MKIWLLVYPIAYSTNYAASATGGGFQNILVIGADALSRYVDWTDRGTCILFGDAAGAVLVQVVFCCLSIEELIQLITLFILGYI